jgi:DUF2997 family protein
MSRIIEVTVSPKGETTIQTKGFTGEQCREQLTSEFHVTAANAQTARQ